VAFSFGLWLPARIVAVTPPAVAVTMLLALATEEADGWGLELLAEEVAAAELLDWLDLADEEPPQPARASTHAPSSASVRGCPPTSDVTRPTLAEPVAVCAAI
jgi:hypothetical protein